MSIRTRRWTRSPRGCVLGVATGLAEWRGLPVDITRFVVFLLFLFTAFFPALMVYLIIAVILPEQTEADIIRDGDTHILQNMPTLQEEPEEVILQVQRQMMLLSGKRAQMILKGSMKN